MRLRTDFWAGVLRRRAEAAGAYVSIARRGAEEAGAVFLVVRSGAGAVDLYGPAPQSVFTDAQPSERLFFRLAEAVSEEQARRLIEREVRFDPDLWVIDIDDRDRRSFVDIAADPTG